MYEHHTRPLISKRAFYNRMFGNLFWGLMILICSLSIGILGYHFIEGINWLDSLLNASMILAGMGPVNEMTTPSGKIFASFYAIFSGVMFLTTIAYILAPAAHRFLHKFHLDDK